MLGSEILPTMTTRAHSPSGVLLASSDEDRQVNSRLPVENESRPAQLNAGY
jgi:hypothetical protein